jgi:ABC-type multidrug transport system fused ATPase/permease subunit
MQDGRIIESGSHDTLLRSRGAYLALVERRHA